MKRLFFLFIAIGLALVASAQGIEFFHGSYEETLKKAREENKQIFVDVYTSWCGPCKMMAKEVFPQPEVGEYFNAHFVCLKLDAEKEKAHGFFKDFKAEAFPSFYWLDAQGKLLDLHVGYAAPDLFLELAAKASHFNLNAQLEEGKRRWESGERTPEIVNTYVLEILGKIDPDQAQAMVWEYLQGLTDEQLEREENYRFLKRFMREPGDNLAFRTLLKNVEIYQHYEKGYDFWINMYRMVVRSGIILRSEPAKYQEYLDFLGELKTPLAEMYSAILHMEYTLFQKDYGQGISEAMKLLDRYNENHPYLAGQFFYTLIIAGFFEEKEVGTSLADQVIALADQALKSVPSKENLLYLSVAYARKGDYRKAYELMASEPFFPKPILSNALYKRLNLPVFHREYLNNN